LINGSLEVEFDEWEEGEVLKNIKRWMSRDCFVTEDAAEQRAAPLGDVVCPFKVSFVTARSNRSALEKVERSVSEADTDGGVEGFEVSDETS